MPAIHLPHEGPPPPSPHKDGETYDRCPRDGCIEVERDSKFGGRDGRGEEYLNWSAYVADVRKGGCGYNWARTTRQGQARDAKHGINSKWLTRSAGQERATSVPSERYQRNYELVDWTK